MPTSKLLSPAKLGRLTLSNHLVMSPMTRDRAIANEPNDLMALYYSQRASAGLIITEGTSPSPNGLGYPRIPGIYSENQIAGWRKVTEAVHAKGGKIFVQLMHTGRVTHPLNLPAGAEVLAPSAIKLETTQMYTDAEGMKDIPTARAMTTEDVKFAIQEYITAAKNAMEAGFDGVELHGSNGYLIEEFLNPGTNHRNDEYGGSITNRAKFLLEIAEGASKAIGADRVGVRISPYGVFNEMPAYPEVDETYHYLAIKLSELGLAYLHVLDHSSMGTPPVPAELIQAIRSRFKQSLILAGGFDQTRAENVIESGLADLVAFGRPFLANPDLPHRFEVGAALNEPDMNTFYTPGSQGYTDYPVLEQVKA